MKRVLLMLIFSVFLVSPALADKEYGCEDLDETSTVWRHSHCYNDTDTDTDTNTHAVSKRKSPVGVGVDIDLYKSEKFNVENQNKYDFRNDEYSNFTVVKVKTDKGVFQYVADFFKGLFNRD